MIGKGLGALAIGGFMIGFLGAFPALLVIRRARKRQEKRNLIAAMAGVRGEHLSRYVEHWNEAFFRPRGVLIRVDLPDEYIDDIRDMGIHRNASSLLSDERAREKAALKARIVVFLWKKVLSHLGVLAMMGLKETGTHESSLTGFVVNCQYLGSTR